MKYIEFNYTDRNGKTSVREVLVLQNANDKLAGVDVSELDLDDQAMLASEYDKLLSAFQEAVLALYYKYDVTNNYREFLPERMEITHSEYL